MVTAHAIALPIPRPHACVQVNARRVCFHRNIRFSLRGDNATAIVNPNGFADSCGDRIVVPLFGNLVWPLRMRADRPCTLRIWIRHPRFGFSYAVSRLIYSGSLPN